MNKIFIICLLVGCLIIISGCTTTGLLSNQTNKTQIVPTPLPLLELKYFTTTNCPLCQQTDLLLTNLSKKYPNRIKITELGLTNADNRAIYAQYAAGQKVKVVPFIVVNERRLLVNYSEIVTHLEPMLKGDEHI
jgi:thiol-disulfide isomerase/thioredoxin